MKKISQYAARMMRAKVERKQVLEYLLSSQYGRSSAQYIAKSLDMTTKQAATYLKYLEKKGKVFKVYPEGGSVIWGLMSRFKCSECGDTEHPSNYQHNVCDRCEDSDVKFQMLWAQTPLTPNPPDMPVWIYQ